MIQIAILGCGTVASGVISLLGTNAEIIRQQVGEEIVIRKVLARTPEKARRLGLREEQICTDIREILGDPEISVVVELIGGTGDAFAFIRDAMSAKKHVVTANKDLIADRYAELAEIASSNGVRFAFEASVGGGIPLIDPLRRTLAANRIRSIVGILNGTTNYILTRMTRDGLEYAEALKKAQELGFAEADPASDVEGLDAARKIAILSTLAFHTPVSFSDVRYEGISGVTKTDIRFALQSGYAVKLLAIARQNEDSFEACVRPALIPLSHPLASVSDSFNAVFISGDAVGDVMLYGRGAGSLPTASSVVGDLMSVVRAPEGNTGTDPLFARLPTADLLAAKHIYYVRLNVFDRPMVLAGIARVFGEHGISLASLVQETRDGGRAELMIFTHSAVERDLLEAMTELRAMDSVYDSAYRICMEETK